MDYETDDDEEEKENEEEELQLYDEIGQDEIAELLEEQENTNQRDNTQT